ncbi:hypothetical protein [Ideonella sp. A 288]|uniref:hypothetical protein n=1 Tax=Ideonella sp. A 288 TaxID=1962181 RepID=UPI000B4BC33D|nr:hypothetical protein [Ideonella sp. A 288]
MDWGANGADAAACNAVTVDGRKGVIGDDDPTGTSSPPSRQALGSAKTTLQLEHWYSPVGFMAPLSSRAIT